MFWQWRKEREGKQQFLVVMLLFVMTGLAIVVYLNQTPLQPRERDYAYAGSFYAFANRVNATMPTQVRSMPLPSG